MHFGAAPGLTPRDLGESSGSDSTTLLTTQMPQHTHAFGAVSSIGDNNAPSSNVSLARSHNATVYAPTGSAPAAFAPQAVGLAGGNQPHNNVQPSLVLNFCIALVGIFPPRS